MKFNPRRFHPKGFHPNISTIDVIKKGSFSGTYFRDICSNVNNRCHKNSWKEFEKLKILIKNIIVQIFMMWI